MSMDLYNANGHMKMGTGLWRETLELAENFGGWEPMGVQVNVPLLQQRVAHLPQDEQEAILASATPGDYSVNNGDIMLGQDAEKLAAALAIALDDLPEFDITDPANALERFSGPRTHSWLKELIAYLHDGGDVTLM
jgi:hypothetical protein